MIRTSNTRAMIGIKSSNRKFPIWVINNQLLPHFNTHKQVLIKLQNNYIKFILANGVFFNFLKISTSKMVNKGKPEGSVEEWGIWWGGWNKLGIENEWRCLWCDPCERVLRNGVSFSSNLDWMCLLRMATLLAFLSAYCFFRSMFVRLLRKWRKILRENWRNEMFLKYKAQIKASRGRKKAQEIWKSMAVNFNPVIFILTAIDI